MTCAAADNGELIPALHTVQQTHATGVWDHGADFLAAYQHGVQTMVRF